MPQFHDDFRTAGLGQRMDSRDWTQQVQDRWTMATQAQPEEPEAMIPSSLRVVDLPGERAQETTLRTAAALARAQGLRLRVDPVGTDPMGPQDLVVFTVGLGDPDEASRDVATEPEADVERAASADLGLVLDRLDRSIVRAQGAAGAFFVVQGLTGERPRVQQAVRQALSERRLRSEGVRAVTVYADPGENLMERPDHPHPAHRASAALADLPVVFPRADLRTWMPAALGSPGLDEGKAALAAYFKRSPERFNDPDLEQNVGAHTWEAVLPTIDRLARQNPFGSGAERVITQQAMHSLQTQMGHRAAMEITGFVIRRAELSFHLTENLRRLTRDAPELNTTALNAHPLLDPTLVGGNRSRQERMPDTHMLIDLMGQALAHRVAGALKDDPGTGQPSLDSFSTQNGSDLVTFAREHSSRTGWGATMATMMHAVRHQLTWTHDEDMHQMIHGAAREALVQALEHQGMTSAAKTAGLILVGGLVEMEKNGVADALALNVKPLAYAFFDDFDRPGRFTPRRLNLADHEASGSKPGVNPSVSTTRGPRV